MRDAAGAGAQHARVNAHTHAPRGWGEGHTGGRRIHHFLASVAKCKLCWSGSGSNSRRFGLNAEQNILKRRLFRERAHRSSSVGRTVEFLLKRHTNKRAPLRHGPACARAARGPKYLSANVKSRSRGSESDRPILLERYSSAKVGHTHTRAHTRSGMPGMTGINAPQSGTPFKMHHPNKWPCFARPPVQRPIASL